MSHSGLGKMPRKSMNIVNNLSIKFTSNISNSKGEFHGGKRVSYRRQYHHNLSDNGYVCVEVFEGTLYCFMCRKNNFLANFLTKIYEFIFIVRRSPLMSF